MGKSNWLVGKSYNLGQKVFSKKEIIDYARQNDPLDFHIDEKVAEESRFNGLVTSGGQAFNYFYVNSWVPKFGKTVEAGLGIKEWNFLAPIYAGDSIDCLCTLLESKATKNPKTCVNHWSFEFRNQDGELAQNLHLTVLHKSNWEI